jgi:hypothetical protein
LIRSRSTVRDGCRLHLCIIAVLFITSFSHGSQPIFAQRAASVVDSRRSNIDLFERQVDSSQLEYFPLHVGDIWEYRLLRGGKDWSKIYKDTVFANGHRYFQGGFDWRTSRGHYLRIDSLLRVVYYKGVSCESQLPGVRPCEDIPDGISYYHLDEPEGSVWWVCSDDLGVLSNKKTLVKYKGAGMEYIIGEWREVRYYAMGLVPSPNDTIWVFTCALARNLGVAFEEWEGGDNMLLVGARINGQVYGSITLDLGGPPSEDDGITLDRCYPNPATAAARVARLRAKDQHEGTRPSTKTQRSSVFNR